MKQLTNERLLEIANYNPGGCLCGHGESCSVCTRSSYTRQFEIAARDAALELLALRGVTVIKVESEFLMSPDKYEITGKTNAAINANQVLLWLADCEAATAYHYDRKGASKSERQRHISICEDTVKMLQAGDLIGHIARKPADVLKRLEEVVKHLKSVK